jgi:5,10-methylenetetrahydrofolate reductase
LKNRKLFIAPQENSHKDELAEWLDELVKMNFFPIFVGVPAPDYKPKTSLKDAYGLWSKNEAASVIGAITIPERHAVLRDEEVRMLDKMSSGVSYFISQCIFNVEYAKMVISDLTAACTAQNIALPTIIFTLTTCGSAKVLDFMEWLGIHVPNEMKEDFLASENILARSTEVCLNIARELTDFCMANSVPFGFNIESVAIRKDEIEASIFILNEVSSMLREKGLRG